MLSIHVKSLEEWSHSGISATVLSQMKVNKGAAQSDSPCAAPSGPSWERGRPRPQCSNAAISRLRTGRPRSQLRHLPARYMSSASQEGLGSRRTRMVAGKALSRKIPGGRCKLASPTRIL